MPEQRGNHPQSPTFINTSLQKRSCPLCCWEAAGLPRGKGIPVPACPNPLEVLPEAPHLLVPLGVGEVPDPRGAPFPWVLRSGRCRRGTPLIYRVVIPVRGVRAVSCLSKLFLAVPKPGGHSRLLVEPPTIPPSHGWEDVARRDSAGTNTHRHPSGATASFMWGKVPSRPRGGGD